MLGRVRKTGDNQAYPRKICVRKKCARQKKLYIQNSYYNKNCGKLKKRLYRNHLGVRVEHAVHDLVYALRERVDEVVEALGAEPGKLELEIL